MKTLAIASFSACCYVSNPYAGSVQNKIRAAVILGDISKKYKTLVHTRTELAATTLLATGTSISESNALTPLPYYYEHSRSFYNRHALHGKAIKPWGAVPPPKIIETTGDCRVRYRTQRSNVEPKTHVRDDGADVPVWKNNFSKDVVTDSTSFITIFAL